MEEGGGEVGKSREVVQGGWRWRRGDRGELPGAFLTGKRGGGGEMLRAWERGFLEGNGTRSTRGSFIGAREVLGGKELRESRRKKIWEEASSCVAMAEKERTRGGRRR